MNTRSYILQWRRQTGAGCQNAATDCSTRCQEQPTVTRRHSATERMIRAPRVDHKVWRHIIGSQIRPITFIIKCLSSVAHHVVVIQVSLLPNIG